MFPVYQAVGEFWQMPRVKVETLKIFQAPPRQRYEMFAADLTRQKDQSLSIGENKDNP